METEDKIINDIFGTDSEKIIYKAFNGVVTIFLPERIETNNADKIQKEINRCISESGCNEIVFDSSVTKYISSAGLRVFMKIYKTHESVKFINVTKEVNEIFDITGFINIFL